MVLVRGSLFIHIFKAKRLYNADGSIFNITKNKSDPYVKVTIGDTTIAKTTILQNTLDPKWDEYFLVDLCHEGTTLDLRVLDKDLIGEDDLGLLKIPLVRLMEQTQLQGEYHLTRNGKKCTGRIQFNITLYEMGELDTTRKVQNCYFQQRRNCKVTLYQDSYCHENELTATLDYKQANAWYDLAGAIEGAEHFIYLTGWSVNTGIKLRRGEDEDEHTLGELLKKKADDGVKVLMMVWDEVTSTPITPGLMGTYDQETMSYFADSKVKCFLLPRSICGDPDKGVFESNISATVYTHHQKTVICDVPGTYVKKKIIAFVGGLDVTIGRCDSPQHDLFSTLSTRHKGDFYQGSVVLDNAECGPRQPWHDIHSQIEGEAALDVLKNFEERWHRQNHHHVAELLKMKDNVFDLAPKYHGEDKWSVQVFRSISEDSAVFSDPEKKRILMQHSDTVFENTIQKAYTHHIRRAKHFVYIENQYFLGSCHMWGKEAVPKKAVQLIPVVLTMRIIDAIEKGEHFTVYVVLPLHPEGSPGDAAIQEILWYQYNTVCMMYGLIADALNKRESDKLPTDYLSFFCLGKREQDIPDDLPSPAEGTQESILRSSRRFMIYVHSKMAIFDDEYIIVGSANINQRSMSGKRDTEIAMGACQTNRKATATSIPTGDVAMFRRSLGIEHMNKRLEAWEERPGTVEGMRAVREEADRNWEQYTSESDQPGGHLLMYPYKISTDGQVTTVTDCFPDTQAKILGSEEAFLIEKITT